MMKNILMIADSHIMEGTPESEEFMRLLSRIAGTEDDVVFLGDIFELWLGASCYEDRIHRQFREWCLQEKKRRELYFLIGNHEFYLTPGRSALFTKVSRSGLLLDHGRLWVVHGDTINSRDHGYTIFRMATRNFLTQAIAFLFGPLCGRYVTNRIRLSMKGQNLVQKKYYPEQEILRLSEKLAAKGVKLAVCGHFHRKENTGIFRVLPNWVPGGGLLGVYHYEDGTFEFRKTKELFPDE